MSSRYQIIIVPSTERMRHHEHRVPEHLVRGRDETVVRREIERRVAIVREACPHHEITVMTRDVDGLTATRRRHKKPIDVPVMMTTGSIDGRHQHYAYAHVGIYAHARHREPLFYEPVADRAITRVLAA